MNICPKPSVLCLGWTSHTLLKFLLTWLLSAFRNPPCWRWYINHCERWHREWLRLLICKTWNKNILGFSLITSNPRQVTDAWRRQGSLGCPPSWSCPAPLPADAQLCAHTLTPLSSWCLFIARAIIISVESQKVTLSGLSPKIAGVAGWQY